MGSIFDLGYEFAVSYLAYRYATCFQSESCLLGLHSTTLSSVVHPPTLLLSLFICFHYFVASTELILGYGEYLMLLYQNATRILSEFQNTIRMLTE